MKWMGWAALLPWLMAPPLAQPLAAQEAVADGAPAAPDTTSTAPTRLADFGFEVEPARPEPIPTEHFAARSAYRGYSLSPDGVHLAIRRIQDGKSDLLLMDAATQQHLKVFNLNEGQQIDWLRWAGNDKLIMALSFDGEIYDTSVRLHRIFVRNIVTNETWLLEPPGDSIWGGDLLHVDEDGSYAVVAVQRRRTSGPSVYRYELVPDGERERIVKDQGAVSSWFADSEGTVRFGLGWLNNRLRIYYRRNAEDDFELVDLLRTNDELLRHWSAVSIPVGSDIGYVLAESENGRVGVHQFDYSKAQTVGTLFEHPVYDVESLWLDREGKPLAAFYTDDRERVHWFDEDLGKTYRELSDALGFEELQIATRSRDNQRMLLWGGDESDPGALYLFSRADRRVDLLGNYRPELDFTQLTRPLPVRYRARDGLMISAYLTLPRGREVKDLPLIIMPHGGPFGVRDRLEYNDEVQLLANRGYAVIQPNYRGSGGYGEAFSEAGYGQIGRAMQDDIDDAMDWAVGEGIADPSRVCVVGGSYGGFAALWAVLRNPERYACAASWAGVTDWARMLAYDKRYLGRERARDLRGRQEGEDSRLADYSPAQHADTLTRPVLLAHGTADRRVPATQFNDFVKASREAPSPPQTLLIQDEGHSFSEEENEQLWYDTLLAFLAEHNPAD